MADDHLLAAALAVALNPGRRGGERRGAKRHGKMEYSYSIGQATDGVIASEAKQSRT